MPDPEGANLRKYVRFNTELSVKYRLISVDPNRPVESEVFEGFTHNISQGGMLLIGRLPNPDYVSMLLRNKIVMALSFTLPGDTYVLKSLCHAAWVESVIEFPGLTTFGINFSEMVQEDREKVLAYILKNQI